MLKKLQLRNVGPSAAMDVPIGERLTVITGDNGLGKSFLLDVAWWALTRKWPAEVNPSLTGGGKALPRNHAALNPNGAPRQTESTLAFTLDSQTREDVQFESHFDFPSQMWPLRVGRPHNPGLVIYAMSDGSFALWDPARNYWRQTPEGDTPPRQPAYVLNPSEVWHGLPAADGRGTICNGLIRDWASWQLEQGPAYNSLLAVLEVLSPPSLERIVPGRLARISVDDARDMPTVRMPYGQDVPVVYLSAAMKRMVALSYFLTWAWSEHVKSSEILAQPPTHQIILLMDEAEAHLHPQWQRRVVPALMEVMNLLSGEVRTQAILTTHSPLVMASLEPIFDATKDCWLDLDYAPAGGGGVEAALTQRDFIKQGDASDWLTSEAFDLDSARSLEAAEALEQAAQAMSDPDFGGEAARSLHQILVGVLPGTDPFWARWRHLAERKGWQL